jgi:hypothetical protein
MDRQELDAIDEKKSKYFTKYALDNDKFLFGGYRMEGPRHGTTKGYLRNNR